MVKSKRNLGGGKRTKEDRGKEDKGKRRGGKSNNEGWEDKGLRVVLKRVDLKRLMNVKYDKGYLDRRCRKEVKVVLKRADISSYVSVKSSLSCINSTGERKTKSPHSDQIGQQLASSTGRELKVVLHKVDDVGNGVESSPRPRKRLCVSGVYRSFSSSSSNSSSSSSKVRSFSNDKFLRKDVVAEKRELIVRLEPLKTTRNVVVVLTSLSSSQKRRHISRSNVSPSSSSRRRELVIRLTPLQLQSSDLKKNASIVPSISSVSSMPTTTTRAIIIPLPRNVENEISNSTLPTGRISPNDGGEPSIPSPPPQNPVDNRNPSTQAAPEIGVAAVIPSPPAQRRRHGIIPRRVTYMNGVGVSDANIEVLCQSPFFCGLMDEYCGFCGAKYFRMESKNRAGIRLMCCKGGKVAIPISICPIEFKSLYTENGERSSRFLANIRAANSLFAMASFKTSAPNANRVVKGQGRWCFTICGQVYHYTKGVPSSQELREPTLSHYYFLDVEEVLDRRNEFLENRVSPETVEFLERCLRRHNRYIRAFQTIGEVLKEETVRRGERPVRDVIIGFCRTGNMNTHRREFDLPESRSEIAAVFYGMESPFDVDLKLYPRRNPIDDAEVGGGQVNEEGGANVERRHELKNLHPMCDPMVYPLLFPMGEDGFSIGLIHQGHRITMREFYRFRIQIRDEFSLLHNGGKLFQQYLVDAWVRVETDMLWWIRQHQDKFRFVSHRTLNRLVERERAAEAVGGNNNNENNKVGRAVILPAAFPGGPRFIQRQYLDAMAVVARHGKPDLFITFTCNPSWPEIKNNLEYNQKPENRPDLLCRVFRSKFLEFMDDIVTKQIYGIVKNYHYVIEFQKRGLPHAHVVVTFMPENSLLTPERVDEIISAVIPDKVSQPCLYGLVAKHQVHRPCGSQNPAAVCMVDGKCRKFFPKEYAERTILGAGRDRRPVYKRPRDNRFISLSDRIITNTRIVPYNPFALAKYHAHLNFEVVGSINTLKYLYKYVTKGPECITICEGGNNGGEQGRIEDVDEVRQYLDCRYVSSVEATWRLLEFKMHDRSHAVIVLPVHLPGDNFLVFNEDEDLDRLEDRLERRSKLEAFFHLNEINPDARRYRYVEIPEHFVWEGRDCSWRPRRQVAKTIGCVANVTLSRGQLELFYLRMLLCHVRGPTSFQDLQTVDGVVKDTFEEACSALSLLSHTDEYDLCLTEAALMGHPRQMRRLFGLIVSILNETIGQVPLLWRKHRNSLIEDFLRDEVGSVEAQIRCIGHIDEVLKRSRPDLTCAAIGVYPEEENDDDDDDNNNEINGNIRGNGNIRRGVVDEDDNATRPRHNYRSLNIDQKRTFLRILQGVSRTTGKLLPVDFYEDMLTDGDITLDELTTIRRGIEHVFYIDGPGGTGKTFLYNSLIEFVTERMGIPVLSMAWTGIAANLLIGGKTVHRGFRLPLALRENTTVGWPLEAEESLTMKKIALILWDEAPMTHRYAVEAVDRYLRELGGSGKDALDMGGKCVVFGGDFRQVLPVVPRGHTTVIINACLKRLQMWPRIVKLKLTENVRTTIVPRTRRQPPPIAQLGGRMFSDWLLALGEGRLPHVSFESDKTLPADLIEIPSIFHVSDLEELLRFVYANGFTAEDVGDKAVLCPTNAMVETVNETILERIAGGMTTYISVDECCKNLEDELDVPQDVLNAINVAGLPPHELKLKVGAVVMLLRNLEIESGECNGSRLKITHLGKHLIEGELLAGQNRGRKVWLPKIKMIIRDSMIPHDVIRIQFPIRLGYAMTINKSQGQTLNKVGVYLDPSCFGHGQLYVAFSRVRTPEDIKVLVQDGLKQGSFGYRGGKKFTRNVVYHTLLNDQVFERAVARRIVPRGDIAEQAEIDEMFGGNRDDDIFEKLNVSQLVQLNDQQQQQQDSPEHAERKQPSRNTTSPIRQFVPYHTKRQLAARISIADQPGTSGIAVRPTSIRNNCQITSCSSSSSAYLTPYDTDSDD